MSKRKKNNKVREMNRLKKRIIIGESMVKNTNRLKPVIVYKVSPIMPREFTIENRNIAIKILTQRGYKVVSNIKEADIVLLGGYSSNEIRSKVSLAFLDAYTEELLFTTEGMYGMGWDINGDVRGALKNALNSIPDKSNSEKQNGIIISENKSASEMNEIEMQLIKLKQLYDDGLIDEDEYKEKKSKVLGL